MTRPPSVLSDNVRLPTSPIRGVPRLVKRAMDVGLSLLALPVALPVMAVTAVVVRLDSPGPAVFRQRRVGEHGLIFWIYKFRTMSLAQGEAADVEGHLEHGQPHKHKDDPRVTRVGRFLRRTSLDELPQLFNILKGEMSLVGPRPELPWIVANYEPWQYARLSVPQGLTGWWQVNGRGDRPMHLHAEDDLYYIEHFSIWLDVKILWKTVWAVWTRAGAF